ncbi:putative uncharacterized protein DDB_G0282133 [Condylostylus longicornis]|uniref:putative uncharacterized protein DDB_G0282133 n=1 Tax=Condylostylus longicornis TaxID=2530218 RepID=UPI00244DB576|nr:putative uncharacterized protein DDB_G0282133 [Condylostylus longicornis]
MGKKGTKKRTQWRTLSITEQDEINATTGTAYISNGNSTTGINIDEASSVDDNFKYSGTNFSYLKRKSSAFSPSSNNYINNNNNNNNSNRNDHFRINSYNTNSSYYYNNKHNSSSINNNNNNSNFIAINTTSNASSVNNDTTLTTLNPNNIRYTRSLSSSSRYSSSYNNNNNNNSNNNRRKPYSMQNGGSLSSTKYYSSYGAGRATSRANRTSYSSYNRNNLNKTSSNNELSSSTSSSSTAANKENYPKPLFNEDEYTRITTPRQDVLFKKGYLSRPRPSYLSSTDTNTNSSATASIVSEESGSTATSVPSSLSPEQCSSIHSDSIVDPEHAFMYSYIDQNGILYVNPFVPPNSFDHYPGQMFMMPYGYSPYNFCPPDLNTPSISDVDNETVEQGFPTEDEKKTSDEMDENSKEEKTVIDSENEDETKEKQSETDEKSEEMVTNENVECSKDINENTEISKEQTDDSTKEQQIDKKHQHNKCYHPHMRSNCDPNFFNFGYAGPPMYQPIFYPINFYGGQPIMPFISPPPYEAHPGIISEESITTNGEGEQIEEITESVDKTECKSIVTSDLVEQKVNPTETEMIFKENDEIEQTNETLKEEENCSSITIPAENATQIQISSENVQSCDADQIESPNIKETENNQQFNVNNLNVNVDEFVPRKPHLNVNVKEFQPRYLQQNDDISISNNLASPVNQNAETILAEKVNASPSKDKFKIENLDLKKPNEVSVEEKNVNVKDSIKLYSTNVVEKIQESSQKPVPTLAEQIKKSLAVQNDQNLQNVQQPKVFQNSNKNLNETNNKIETKDTKSNFKNKDKAAKINNKSSNRNKNNRSYTNMNSNSEKNVNVNKKNSTTENVKVTKSSNTVLEQEKVSAKPSNVEKSVPSLPSTNVLSYAQMLNKDLIPAEEKATNKEATSTNTNAAISTEENDLDDAEVQRLIKSLETAEKLTAMKENISWQTVKSRGKRNKHYKDYSGQVDKEFIDLDFVEKEMTLPVEENINMDDIQADEVLETKTIHSENATNVENSDISQIDENIETTSATGLNSENKSTDKKKSKQKNKKSTKKTPNAKKTAVKDKTQVNPGSHIEINENVNENLELPLTKLNKTETDKNIEMEDIDNDTLALKLYEDLEKELDLKLKSNLEEDEDDNEVNEKIIMGNSPDLLMKHSALGRNLDMLNGFDYKYKTKNILKEEEEMVLNVIKSLSSNGSSPIGCNKKSDNIFNASFIALNGCNQSSVIANNSLGNIKTNLSEDPKNLIRKSSCSENTNTSTPNCGKFDQENNINLVDGVLNTVAEVKQHEDSNGTKQATVPSQLIKSEQANSDYIQNCIKESLKWIKKMESVEKSIDNLDVVQSSINGKVINVKEDEKKLTSFLLKQNETVKATHLKEETKSEQEPKTENDDKKKLQEIIKLQEKLEKDQLNEDHSKTTVEYVKNEISAPSGELEPFSSMISENADEVEQMYEMPDALTENGSENISNTKESLHIEEKLENSENQMIQNDEIDKPRECLILGTTIIEETPKAISTKFGEVSATEQQIQSEEEIVIENVEDDLTKECNGHQNNDINFASTDNQNFLQFDINGQTENSEKETVKCDRLFVTEQNEPSTIISNENEVSENMLKIEKICKAVQNHKIDIENDNDPVFEAVSKELSEHDVPELKLKKKLNGDLLEEINYSNNGLNCIKDINQNLKDTLIKIDKNFNESNHTSSDIICNQINGNYLENSYTIDKAIELHKNHKNGVEESILNTERLCNLKEINQTAIPLYNNDEKIYRERLSHSLSDSNDIAINENGLDKHKSTSSLALQLQQLEEQLRKLDRIATPPLVCDEQINGYYHSETDLNSLESSETNSSTLEDSLTSPKNETYCSNTSCSSGIDFHDNNHNISPIFNEPITNTNYAIDLDLSSSSNNNTNSKDCDSLNVTKSSDDKKCSKLFPCLSVTNEIESPIASHDIKKFPLTHAVKQWLEHETKEKTPEPILRLPDDPNLNIRIKSSLSLHRLQNEDNNEDNYYQEDDCWSLTDNSEDEEYSDGTEIEDNENKEDENSNKENKIKKSKNLKSNPLHVSSLKINDVNNQNQNDNDSDYNSDNPLSNIKFEIYDDNTCERVATKNNNINKSDENITISLEQQIEYYWDDFIENPSKYLQQNPKRNSIYNIKNNNNNNINDNNSLNYRNNGNTVLDTMESRFSSGNSSMNELNDLTPYESLYGKSINYNKLLTNHNELLSNNIINFNNNNKNKENDRNDDDDDNYVDDNNKNYFNKEKFQKNYSIAINHNNENDTSLNKNINLNNDNNNNCKNNNDNCIKPPEVCCMLM